MMAQMFAKATGLSKGRDSALHSGVNELGIFGNTSMLGANLPVAAGLGAHLQDGKDRQRRHRLLRRRRQQHRRLPRGAQLRRRPAAADRLHLREQSVRVLGAGREEHGDRRCGRSRGELRVRRRRDQRQRRAGGLPGDAGRARARARRRRPDADRVQDLPLARPLRARQGVLSHRTKSWRCGRAAIRSRPSRPTSKQHERPDSTRRTQEIEAARQGHASTMRCEFARTARIRRRKTPSPISYA